MEKAPIKQPVPSEPVSVVSLAASWVSAVSTRIRLITELALAEAKLAAISVVLMMFLAILAAAFMFGAWGFLMAGLVLGLVQLQLPLWPVLLVLGGLHFLIAAIAWRVADRLSKNLEFPASKEQFNLHVENANDIASSAAKS